MTFDEMLVSYYDAETTNNRELMDEIESGVYDLLENPLTVNQFSYAEGFLGLGVLAMRVLSRREKPERLDEILSDVDSMAIKIIDFRPAMDSTLRCGILGLAVYVYCRLSSADNASSDRFLDLRERTVYLIDWIEDAFPTFDKEELFFCLILLKELNIFNHKIYELLSKI